MEIILDIFARDAWTNYNGRIAFVINFVQVIFFNSTTGRRPCEIEMEMEMESNEKKERIRKKSNGMQENWVCDFKINERANQWVWRHRPERIQLHEPFQVVTHHL